MINSADNLYKVENEISPERAAQLNNILKQLSTNPQYTEDLAGRVAELSAQLSSKCSDTSVG